MELVGVKCIGENTFQIIGITNQDNEFIKANFIAMVARLSEKAEKCYGIPKEEYAHTIPAKLVVHSTYSFMSGADIEAFLKECQDI